MREWIPSKAVREYMEKRGKVLSDFDKAALAWHHPDMRFRERTETLKKIMETTQDRELAGQIQERLAYDRKCLGVFFEKREGMVFAFCAYSEEDREWESYGYYASGELAYDYGKKYAVSIPVMTAKNRFPIPQYRLTWGVTSFRMKSSFFPVDPFSHRRFTEGWIRICSRGSRSG